MTRLINIDNGGTLTDFCFARRRRSALHQDPDHPVRPEPVPVRRPGQRSSELAYGEPRGSPRCCRARTASGTPPPRAPTPWCSGPGRSLACSSPTRRWWRRWCRDPGPGGPAGGAGRRRWGVISLDAVDEELSRELLARVNDLSARGAPRRPRHRGERRRGAPGRGPGQAGCCSSSTPGICSARSRCCSPGSSWPTPTISAAPGRACSTRSCTRPWSGSCSTRTAGCGTPGPASPLRIFRNDGASSRVSESAALKTYSSAPRGGLEGTRALAARYGLRHLVMLDVGGTTTDIGVVSDGAIQRRPARGHRARAELAGTGRYHQLRRGRQLVFRVVDGRLAVGPDSVGAAPGPACFGLGGDPGHHHRRAACWPALLDPATYLGGTLALYPDRSVKVIKDKIAWPPGHPARRRAAADGGGPRGCDRGRAGRRHHPSPATPYWPRSAGPGR